MTVAAVILAASAELALVDADGTPAVRRIVDSAWAGGATPVVVVAHDPAGALAAALATTEATLLDAGPSQAAPAALMGRGLAGAAELVGATTASLVWPVAMAWADAETVTTLIEAHGEDLSAILRPTWDGVAGWPALVPQGAAGQLAATAPGSRAADVIERLIASGIRVRDIDAGDPGATHDVRVPRSDLPPYAGPPRPTDDIVREWGAPAADQSDDAPPAGPARLAQPDPAP